MHWGRSSFFVALLRCRIALHLTYRITGAKHDSVVDKEEYIVLGSLFRSPGPLPSGI